MASLSTLELLPNLALACLPPALKPEGEAWVHDLQRLVKDPTSDPASMSSLISRLPALLQHLSKPFLAFSASVIVSDLKQYLPPPATTSEASAAASSAPATPLAANASDSGAEGVKTEAAGDAQVAPAPASRPEAEERNRKALEKIVAGVLDLMLAHQALLSRPPPPPPPAPAAVPAPSPAGAGPSTKRALNGGAGSGREAKRARREQAERERYKGILELSEAEIDRLAQVPEPERYKEWLQRTFVAAPTAQVAQSAFWHSYTSTFRPALERLGSAMPPLLSPGEAIKNVNVVFEAAAPKMAGEGESKVFVIQGIEVRPLPPPREPTPEDDSDDDEGNGGGPSNRAVLSRLAEVEGKLDRVLAALGK